MRGAAHVGTTVAMAFLVTPALAFGSTYNVVGAADSTAPCVGTSCPSLRAAVLAADGDPGSTIKLGPVAYALGNGSGMPVGTGELRITADMTIAGAGSGATTIRQTDGANRVISIVGRDCDDVRSAADRRQRGRRRGVERRRGFDSRGRRRRQRREPHAAGRGRVRQRRHGWRWRWQHQRQWGQRRQRFGRRDLDFRCADHACELRLGQRGDRRKRRRLLCGRRRCRRQRIRRHLHRPPEHRCGDAASLDGVEQHRHRRRRRPEFGGLPARIRRRCDWRYQSVVTGPDPD